MHKKILAICAALVALGALALTPALSSAAVIRDTVSSEAAPIEAAKKGLS